MIGMMLAAGKEGAKILALPFVFFDLPVKNSLSDSFSNPQQPGEQGF